MASIWKMGSSICALLALGGCVGMTVGPIPVSADTNSDLDNIQNETRRACLSMQQPGAPVSGKGASSGEATSSDEAASSDEVAANDGVSNDGPAPNAEAVRMARNDLVTAYMFAIDRSYNAYERQLLDSVRSGDAGASIATIGLSTIAGVVGNENLARGLTTASAIVTGTHTTIGRDYLLNQTMGVLQTQMRASRATQRGLILERLRLQYADWTVCTALSDVLAYEQAGTLNAALVAVAASAAQANEEGQARAEQAIPTVAFNRSAQGRALQSFINPAGAALAADRQKKVRELMSANNLVPANDNATHRLYVLAYLADPADDGARRTLIERILADTSFPDDLKTTLRASINQ